MLVQVHCDGIDDKETCVSEVNMDWYFPLCYYIVFGSDF